MVPTSALKPTRCCGLNASGLEELPLSALGPGLSPTAPESSFTGFYSSDGGLLFKVLRTEYRVLSAYNVKGSLEGV